MSFVKRKGGTLQAAVNEGGRLQAAFLKGAGLWHVAVNERRMAAGFILKKE